MGCLTRAEGLRVGHGRVPVEATQARVGRLGGPRARLGTSTASGVPFPPLSSPDTTGSPNC